MVERIFLALEYEGLLNISTLYLPEYMVSIKIKKMLEHNTLTSAQ